MRGWLAIALLGALVGCNDEGEPGDLDLVPPTKGSVRGNGATLAELNDPDAPTRAGDGEEVTVTGISVVAVDTYDETKNGSSAGNIYAQDLVLGDTPQPFSGITLFDPAFNPPSLRVAAGDVVDVHGTYDEFPGPASSPFDDGQSLPEIVGGSMTLRFESASPEPVTVPLAELASYDTGRKWIGMLVRVDNVTVAAPPNPDNLRFAAKLSVPGVDAFDIPEISNALFDVGATGLNFDQNAKFTSVVGVVQYFYNFKICPRSVEDLIQ